MNSPNDPLSRYPAHMTDEQVAEHLNLSPFTVRGWRANPECPLGPPFIKLGNGPKASIRYPREDLRAWLAANTVQTATPTPVG